MIAFKRSRPEIAGSADPVWWGVAALLGLGSLWLPYLLKLQGDRMTQVIVVQSALFFTGTVLGCFRPQRVWRWATACFVAFAMRDALAAGLKASVGALSEGVVWQDILLQLAGNSPAYLLHCLPVLVGAYIGSSLSTAGLK